MVVILTRDFKTFSQGSIDASFKQGGQLKKREQALSGAVGEPVAQNESSRIPVVSEGATTSSIAGAAEDYNRASNAIKVDRSGIIHVSAEKKLQEPKESSYAPIWNDTVRLLFQNSDHLDQMLAGPPLSVYVYDTLPKSFDLDVIARCVYEKYQPNTAARSNCNWEPKVCKEVQTDNTPKAKYSSHRNNYNHDVAIIKYFQDYPGRVTEPNQADIFVVPYPHKSHCLCHKDLAKQTVACSYNETDFQNNVLSSLPYYNKSSVNRHLFIQGVDWSVASSYMMNKPLVLTLGDAKPCTGKKPNEPCGAIVVPYLNTNPEYQPKYLASLSEEWWTTRPRLYSVGAVMGRRKVLKERMQFLTETDEILLDSNASLLGGLPIKVVNLHGVRKLARQDEAMEIYRNSTVCPILAGDGCPQKRVFDVMMSGCIPVVLHYATSNEQGWPSWYKEGACSIRTTYPFAKGTFAGDPKAGIDWESLVIPVNGSCGFPCMKSTIEAVMRDTKRLAELRRRLRKVASLFSYGLEEESSASMDAFAALLVKLKHYVVTSS